MRFVNRATILLVVGAVVIVGCNSPQRRLVGVWKAVPITAKSSPNFQDAARSAMLGLASQNLEVEFNAEGKFKFGAGIGWGTGKYQWEGDTLVLTFDTYAPQAPMNFVFEGEELVQKTDFASDIKLRFKKKA